LRHDRRSFVVSETEADGKSSVCTASAKPAAQADDYQAPLAGKILLKSMSNRGGVVAVCTVKAALEVERD
jgi:hypothetical protein